MKKHEIGSLVGSRIKELREMRGFSQVLLASKCLKAVETISNFERGRTLPSLVTLISLGKILNVDINSFFEFSAPTDKKVTAIVLVGNQMRFLSLDDQELLLMIADSMGKHRAKK